MAAQTRHCGRRWELGRAWRPMRLPRRSWYPYHLPGPDNASFRHLPRHERGNGHCGKFCREALGRHTRTVAKKTIRALMIHSSEWTPVMRAQLDAATSEQQKRVVLRKYGYGVPDYDRAVLSAANDLTLIVEDELQPFFKDGTAIKTRHMNLHRLPWPRTELEQLGEMAVELRVTLSYYVEPNPGERGWLRKHRYPSYALRFAVNRALETDSQFRTRINKAAAAEEQDLGIIDTGPDNWVLGRIRNVGSIHSDYWQGTAADLAKRSLVGVYPIGGWWKENPYHHRYDQYGPLRPHRFHSSGKQQH